MKGAAVLMVFLLMIMCGCGNDSASSEKRKIKETIMTYNRLLSDGYRSLNMNPLQQAATKFQAEKLYVHMAALGEGRVRMESALKEIQFDNLKIEQGDKATVKTKERWDFRHINIDTGKEVLNEKNFEYLLTYRLVKEGSRWLVDKVVAEEGANAGRISSPTPAQGRFSSMLREKYRKSKAFTHP